MPRQSRRFTLTIFSPVEGKKPKIPDQPDFVEFFIGQREICPTTGKRHYQCYFEIQDKRTLGPVIKDWERHLGHHSFHIEMANATQRENIAYCTKDETFDKHRFRYGEKIEQGQRTDLWKIHENVNNGWTDYDFYQKNPEQLYYHKFINVLRQARNEEYKKKLRDIEVIYIHGPPGTGKSSFVWEEISDKEFYQPPPPKNGTFWFDGYTGQDILWLEDINPVEFDRSLMLRILDRYPLTVEYKGGTCQACWTKVYITSNTSPEFLDEAIQRRFTEIVDFDQ